MRNEKSVVEGAARRLVIAILGVAALGSALACAEEEPAPPDVARPIKISTVGDAEAGAIREFPGQIRPALHSDMAFEVPGRIIEFRFREGDSVEQGEVLARLDPRDYEARLDSANAKLNQAKTDLERAEALYKEKVLAKSSFDLKQNVFDAAAANAREAQKALDDTVLVAPFGGVMARKLVEDFENIRAKQPVLMLQDDSHLEIKVSIPERDLAGGDGEKRSVDEVTREIRPAVVVSSLPGQRFPARLKELATQADAVSRTFEATFMFDNPSDTVILPGMTAKVIVHVSAARARSGLHVPAGAVLADPEGRSSVWLVDPASMTVSRRPVEVGELAGNTIEIVAGLEPGQQIAVSGVHNLREGAKVRRYQGTPGGRPQ